MCSPINAMDRMALQVALEQAALAVIPLHGSEDFDAPGNTAFLLVAHLPNGDTLPLGRLYGPSQQEHIVDGLPLNDETREWFADIVNGDGVALRRPSEEFLKKREENMRSLPPGVLFIGPLGTTEVNNGTSPETESEEEEPVWLKDILAQLENQS